MNSFTDLKGGRILDTVITISGGGKYYCYIGDKFDRVDILSREVFSDALKMTIEKIKLNYICGGKKFD